MPGTLGKNLNLCFAKIKRPASPESSVHGQDQSRPLSSKSPASILIKNFNSLYDFTFECTTSTTAKSLVASDDFSSDSDTAVAATPDFASVFASQRFFFSSPGSSNSIIDSSSASSSSGLGSYLASTSSSSSPVDPPEPENLVGGSIAIPTDSPDPFVDFRRSMQEMVEANNMIDVRTNWEYLHKLLMCYLSLNPKSTHKFIVGAFSDLLVSLMTLSSAEDGRRKSSSDDDDDGRGKISRGYACN